MTRNLFAVLALLSLAACRSIPRHEERSTAGVVRSDDPAKALVLLALAEELTPQVCARLGVEPAEPFVIHHAPGGQRNGVAVRRDGDRIVERFILLGDAPDELRLRFITAHELIHWYATAPWDRLPHTVEEGLADYLAAELAPAVRDNVADNHDWNLGTLTPERRKRAWIVDQRDWPKTPQSACDDAYSIGFEICRRLGVDGVRALCVRAEREGHEFVPIEWFEIPAEYPVFQRRIKLDLPTLD